MSTTNPDMPEKFPMVDSSDDTSSYEPPNMCPDRWGGNALGFNLQGRRVMEMSDQDMKPEAVQPYLGTRRRAGELAHKDAFNKE